MDRILNLTDKMATPREIKAGVVELKEIDREELNRLYVFERPISYVRAVDKACNILHIAEKYDTVKVMIKSKGLFNEILRQVLCSNKTLSTISSSKINNHKRGTKND